MSKETMEQIRMAEAEADRLIADAESRAARMKSDAVAEGRAICAAAEKAVAVQMESALETARKQADDLTAKAFEEANREADGIAKIAERGRKAAEAIVIGGLEAKCR